MPFFNASASLPFGTTNPWSQTGSMRVRDQNFIVCFPFFFFFLMLLHTCLHHTLLPFHPSLLKDTEPSPHRLQSILPFITYSSTLDTSCPPVSSVPPLLLPHLVLSVNLPIPLSHELIPSSPCDPHLDCFMYDVGTHSGHPVCLLSVRHCSCLWRLCWTS